MFATFRVRLQLLHVRVSCSTSSSLSWPNLRWDEKTHDVKAFRSCPQISHLPDTKSQGFVAERESHKECQSVSKSQD